MPRTVLSATLLALSHALPRGGIRALLLGAALVAVAAASLATSALRATPTQAGIVANEYSMEVRIASTNVAVGATFQVQLFIEHGGVTDPLDCFDGLVNGIDDDGDTNIDDPAEAGLGSPFAVPPFGCYAGAQWYLQYNGIYVDLPTGTGNITKVAAAPAACNQEFDDGALNRALVACSTTLGLPNAELAYTGAAWNLQFTCVAAGFADFTLIATGTGEVTFVNDGNVNLPIHTHADSVECGTGGPTRTNTATPCRADGCATSTPTATPTPTPLPIADVFVDPAAQTVSLPQSVVNVRARTVTDLGRYEFNVAWTPAVVSLQSIVDGGFLGSTTNPVSCGTTILAAGQVNFACVETGTAAGPNGNGLLAIMAFNNVADGVSPIPLTGVALLTTTSLPIITNASDGAITVLLPTPTPTPTSTATATLTNTPTATPTPAVDSDGDGCTDVEELGSDHLFGGQRDPADSWDFYDVDATKSITLNDTLLILEHFGHGADDDALDNVLDRYVPDSEQAWRAAESNNGVNLADALANLSSFGDSCVGPVPTQTTTPAPTNTPANTPTAASECAPPLLTVAEFPFTVQNPYTVGPVTALMTGNDFTELYWLSTVGIDAVYVHGDTGTNTYYFPSSTDGGLTLSPLSAYYPLHLEAPRLNGATVQVKSATFCSLPSSLLTPSATPTPTYTPTATPANCYTFVNGAFVPCTPVPTATATPTA